jgi:hypothetical protein
MKLLIGLLVFSALSAHALETDNYLSWGKTLPDSGDDINQLIREQIEDVVAKTPSNASCEQITFNVAFRFKTTPRRKLFENWSEKSLTEKMFPASPYYLEQSIYRNTSRFYLSKSGMSPNLMVNGVYFGVDKLSHFGSTGRRYLAHFLKKLKKGYSVDEAEKSAIRKGLKNEAGILGLWPSGVFSYGDMEANFQGFTFYKKLCLDEQDTYLKNEDGKWKLVKAPDIRTFISPYWDETFNLSFRAPGMWNVTSRVLKTDYCPLKDKEEVVSRFNSYRAKGHISRSLTYIKELQAGHYHQAPIPTEKQSFDELCAEN